MFKKLSVLTGLMMLFSQSAFAVALPYLPPSTIWNAAMPISADGWIEVSIPNRMIQNRLMLCDGVVVDTKQGPTCHQLSSKYSKPSFFEAGHRLLGAIQPFITPQQYLDKVANRHPDWHQKLIFSAIGLSQSNEGTRQIWLFYRIESTDSSKMP